MRPLTFFPGVAVGGRWSPAIAALLVACATSEGQSQRGDPASDATACGDFEVTSPVPSGVPVTPFDNPPFMDCFGDCLPPPLIGDEPAIAVNSSGSLLLHGQWLLAVSGAMSVLDPSTAGGPTLVSQHRFDSGPAIFAHAAASAVAVVTSGARLHVVEVTETGGLEETGNVDLSGVPYRMAAIGGTPVLVHAETTATKLISVDLGSPSAPRLATTLEVGIVENASGQYRATVAPTATHLYVAAPLLESAVRTRIERVDAGLSGALVVGATATIDGVVLAADQLQEEADIVSVTAEPTLGAPGATASLTTLRASDLSVLGRVALGPSDAYRRIHHLRVGSRAVVVIGSALASAVYVVDLSDPTQPAVLGTADLAGASVLALRAGREAALALVAQGENVDVRLIDVMGVNPAGIVDVELLPGTRTDTFVHMDTEAGIAVVPFAESTTSTCEPYPARVGILSVSGAGLELLGTAEVARFVSGVVPLGGTPFVMSHGRVDAMPGGVVAGSAVLSAPVSDAHAIGSNIARVGVSRDARGEPPLLDVVDVASAELPPLEDPSTLETGLCPWSAEILGADGDLLQVGVRGEVLGASNETTGNAVVSVDTAGGVPVMVGVGSLPDSRGRHSGNDYGPWKVGNAVALYRLMFDGSSTVQRAVDILDVSDPARAVQATAELPGGSADGTDPELGAVADGAVVASTRHELVGEGARFFLDRVDLSNPAAPFTLPPVSVPGLIVGYSELRESALVLEPRLVSLPAASVEECRVELGPDALFHSQSGSCLLPGSALVRVRIEEGVACRDGEVVLPSPLLGRGLHASEQMLAAVLLEPGRNEVRPPRRLLVVRWDGPTLEPQWIDVQDVFWTRTVVAGTRAALFTDSGGDVLLLDATDTTVRVAQVTVPAVQIQSVSFAPDALLVALGEDGLALVPFD